MVSFVQTLLSACALVITRSDRFCQERPLLASHPAVVTRTLWGYFPGIWLPTVWNIQTLTEPLCLGAAACTHLHLLFSSMAHTVQMAYGLVVTFGPVSNRVWNRFREHNRKPENNKTCPRIETELGTKVISHVSGTESLFSLERNKKYWGLVKNDWKIICIPTPASNILSVFPSRQIIVQNTERGQK